MKRATLSRSSRASLRSLWTEADGEQYYAVVGARFKKVREGKSLYKEILSPYVRQLKISTIDSRKVVAFVEFEDILLWILFVRMSHSFLDIRKRSRESEPAAAPERTKRGSVFCSERRVRTYDT